MVVTILVRPTDGRMVVLMLDGIRMEAHFHNSGNWFGKSRVYSSILEANEVFATLVQSKTKEGFILAHSWASPTV